MEEFERQLQRRVDALPSGLQAHIYRVKDIARDLAQLHGVDGERAALGMLAHDVARATPNQELLRQAAELGLPVGTVERIVPLLLHGPVGAELLAREDGLEDQAIYRAVYWHSTSHIPLDDLGKVVFLADKLDPQKSSRFPYLPELHQIANQSLDRALLEFLTKETIALASKGRAVHPAMVETRNHLLAELGVAESPATRP